MARYYEPFHHNLTAPRRAPADRDLPFDEDAEYDFLKNEGKG